MTMPRIRQLLDGRLKTWADARVPALQIAWPNIAFDAPTGAYLRAFVLPADTESNDLEGLHRHYSGIFQVSVVAARDSGPDTAEGIAEEIAALFPNNLRLTIASPPFALTMITPMSLARAIVEPDRYIIPVSASYRADTI